MRLLFCPFFPDALLALRMGSKWGERAFMVAYDTIPAVDSMQIITMLPAMFLTLIFQRYIIGGLTGGAVKG